jgi:hypothetical protein
MALETLRYVAASFTLGLISVWASENLFWSAPPDDLTLPAWVMTWIVYSLASACALSAVAWTGIGGWRAVFLGGAILGFVVEGVVVGTMYDGFPLQLVWTPLAWHALITGLAVGGVARADWPLPRLAAAQLATGALAGTFALYWPLERAVLPGPWAVAGYIAGIGLVLPFGHWVLDRMGTVPRPAGWVLCVVPALGVVLWGVQTVASLNPLRLACPVMIGLTLWAMSRLGGRAVISFGVPGRALQRASVILVPFGMLAVALPGWAILGGVAVNVPFALGTGGVALGVWLWCLWQAAQGGNKTGAMSKP